MSASKHATPPGSADAIGATDLAKVDAHVIRPEEYDELPELDDAMMERADLYAGATLIRRGRPPKGDAKEAVSIRLSPQVLDHFRAGGPGWQTRINDILLRVAAEEGAPPRR